MQTNGLAQADVADEVTSSTTTEVPRVVGDPLPAPVFFGSGVLLLAAIVVFGVFARRRTQAR